MVMQGLYAKTHSSPLEARYWSCTPYLLREGQAMQYFLVPRDGTHAGVGEPAGGYLREALATSLRERDLTFDFLIQWQTDPHRMPIENASVAGPNGSPRSFPWATLRLPRQDFDATQHFALADRPSFNPWHALPEHRPRGSQNRARRAIYLRLSGLGQSNERHTARGPR
jgi:hypothetical protein